MPAIAHAVTFGPPTNFAAGDGPRSVAVGDFNGDSLPDLAVANENSDNVSLLLGTAGGAFTGPTNFAAGDAPVSLAIGHFNGGSHPDLAVANNLSNNVSILLGDGAGGFSGPTNVTASINPQSVAVADFNGDSRSDVVSVNSGFANASILLGNGSGGFSGPTNVAVGGFPISVATGSFNGNVDSHADLAVGNPGSNTVSVLLGNGSGGFGSPTNFAVGNGTRSVASGHFNGDLHHDLAVVNNQSNNVSILLGNGSGSFGAANNIAVGTGPLGIATGDVSADSLPDLVITNASASTVSTLLREGNGFGVPSNFAAGTFPYAVAVGEFSGDSRPDLVTANNNSDNVSILLNTTGFVRPKTASPARVSLVPAYNECTSPNRVHGPPDFPGNGSDPDGSCNPPAQSSAHITAGNPNANFTGSAKLSTFVGVPGGADDADVGIDVKIDDVRCQAGTSTCGPANAAGGADYTGEVQVRIELRITDRYNGSTSAGGSDQATGDKTFEVTVPCGATSTPNTVGSTCALSTTADAVYGDPSAVKEGVRTVWALGRVHVYDGGSDGDVETPTGNTLFATQGLFVP